MIFKDNGKYLWYLLDSCLFYTQILTDVNFHFERFL